ncbi:sporulation protein YpjB [Bacillus fonticola]|uniref:sporulation protein YpjB n=1 Tax=Bacillus fonticola TaxID=2728853 RepID=UPI0014752389|nr:sporulation protein YpjB [Bacillus fonticola]
MIRSTVTILLLTLFMSTNLVAVAENPYATLHDQAQDVLHFTKMNRPAEAYRLLQEMEGAMQQSLSGWENSEASQTVLSLYEETERVLREPTTKEERIRSATGLYLVVDALHSEQEPLWKETKAQMLSYYQQMLDAVDNGDQEQFHFILDVFMKQYETIYPSAKIDAPDELVQKVDARVHYIDNYRPEVLANGTKAYGELVSLEADLTSLYEGEEDEADPSLLWVMFTTGSIIVATLSYVGFRKYKGDKEKQQARKKQRD